jgi:type IV pilus assembly protein PilB
MENSSIAVLERFSRKFGHLLGSGVPLVPALEIIHSEAENPQFGELLGHVIEMLKDGRSLTEAMSQYPGFFSKSFLGMIKAGEAQGALDSMMGKIADGLKLGSIAPGSGILSEVQAQSVEAQALVNKLLKDAVTLKASDVHLIPGFEQNIVSFRIDGFLKEQFRMERTEFRSLIARLKVMCCLDVAEQQLPQDGRMLIAIDKQRFDIRMSVIPVAIGEKAVLKLLSKEKVLPGPEKIFPIPADLAEFKKMIGVSHGLTIFSGPCGSGKTTTAYCAVTELVKGGNVSVETVESPVEFLIEGAAQICVRPKVGMTWEQCLAAVMRGDPDVLMVNDIPSPEIMEMLLNIALSGHLVLANINGNDVADSLRCLMFLKAPPHILSSILTGVVCQRLLRKNCPDCSRPEKVSAADAKLLSLSPAAAKGVKGGTGCEKCHFSGYRGRLAVYEMFRPGKDFRDALMMADPEKVARILEKETFTRFPERAADLLKAGKTSIPEVKRVLFSDFPG